MAPSKRECHTICVSGDRLVLFGGNDDAGRFREVHILDTVSMRWSKIEATEQAPGKRSAHSAVMDAEGRWMYIFGGWNGTEELADVTRFDVGKLQSLMVLSVSMACDQPAGFLRFPLHISLPQPADKHIWERIIPRGIVPSARHFQMSARVGNRM